MAKYAFYQDVYVNGTHFAGYIGGYPAGGFFGVCFINTTMKGKNTSNIRVIYSGENAGDEYTAPCLGTLVGTSHVNEIVIVIWLFGSKETTLDPGSLTGTHAMYAKQAFVGRSFGG